MQEIIDLVIYYARAVWNKRWYALVIAWVLAIGGWAFVMKLPNEYQASARVNIDTQSVLRPMLRGLAFTTSARQQVALMVSTLLSRPNLEKIARITDLDLTVKTEQEMDALLNELKSGIRLSRVDRGQDLYKISYTHSDRDVAKKVVQAVLTVFVENTLGGNREDSVTARRFLDAELKEYEQRLKEAEGRVVEFKRKNIAYLSGSGGDFYQRLQEMMKQVESAKLALTEVERQRDSIKGQLESQKLDLAEIEGDGGKVKTVYDDRINALETRLDEMFLKYTERHPDVITIKAQVEDLKQKRDEEIASRNEILDPDNPIFQSLQLSLGESEARVAALQARVKNFEQKVENLQKMVHTVPAIEAEMADLNRDYGVVKNKFQELLSRREQAALSQKASQASDDIQFKVIDPTRVPFEPSGPPRIKYMSGVLAAAFGAGIGFALLLVIIRPTFASAKMLALETGLPVLGTVGYVRDSTIAVARRHFIYFVGLTFLLLALFSALMLYQLLFSAQAPLNLL